MDLLKECSNAKRIGISGHVRPDGDCVGAVLGLQLYLRKCMPEAEVKVFLEKPAEIFNEIKGFEEIDSEFTDKEPFDIFFVLDTAADRLGGAEKYFKSAGKRINIDHHISNMGTGDVNLVLPSVGSTCEILFDLMEEDKVDRDIAMAIYTGMIHDTGVFQYSNTTPATMEKGARLISYGFDFSRLIQETFYQRTYLQAQIMGRALMESIRFMEGRCIVSAVDQKTMDFYNVEPKDFEGIVSQLRNIKGVDCAIFMYQTGVQEYKVSLRSSDKVDVAEVAAYFGGGGHARAAGCTMKGNFYDCVNNLSLHISKQMEA
ncbi:MAG: bifunctional oligoribonuclease/PAP phosphatase NrnA [Acetatifactor sp.]|nr:bifunctional oligoribonuclease/PAP phosphatase NrnA [Acetatifactor sp.]MDE7351974.1 bifunctional oligoribonuclease/PAP phosphatase NrnA [Acetatifactor sp.]